VAISHGATPYSFCKVHLGDPSFWARDIDRGIAPRHEAAIAAQAGLAREALQDMTLRAWIGVLTPASYSASSAPAVVPWINAAGVFHRMRRLHALQFCARCLAEGHTLDKRWRLSFFVACPRHQRLLSDACPHCDAPFVPHRSVSKNHRCHACGRSLLLEQPSVGEIDGATLRLQAAMGETLEAACAMDDEARADLHGLRLLVSAVRGAVSSAGDTTACDQGSNIGAPRRVRLETARLGRRRGAMERCSRLLADWPDSFRVLAQELHLRREAFGNHEVLPGWLVDEVGRLPRHRPKAMPRRHVRLDERIRRLESGQPNWRAMRGTLMVRAATRKP
jgi:hypothetical protein